MKKAKKSTTTPAKPAPVPAKSSAKPTKKTVIAAKPKSTRAKVAKPASAPEVKSSGPKPVVTKIVAQIDVGFGNTLSIRGEGPGLNWETGVVMDCVGDVNWTYTAGETSKPIVFKFLVNDLTWCVGDDYIASPGTTVKLTPVF